MGLGAEFRAECVSGQEMRIEIGYRANTQSFGRLYCSPISRRQFKRYHRHILSNTQSHSKREVSKTAGKKHLHPSLTDTRFVMLNCWSTAPGRLIDTPTLRARRPFQALDHLSQQKYFGQCWNCFRPISIADRVETAKLCQKACMLVGPGMKSAFSSHSPLWFALPPHPH